MTSIPEVPGAAALYLDKEETTEDALHMFSYYVRLKVLTERGLENANVELPFFRGESGANIDSIAGRTIHPDGSVVPFTGKPYEKLIAKAGNLQEKAKVFTLPAVTVGSIIEYRYKLHLDDNYYRSPDWFIQSDLFTRKAHYMWKPTDRDLYNDKGERVSGRIAWQPILPAGAEVKSLHTPLGALEIDLDIRNVAPFPHEEYMPPMQSVSYRVLFYYTAYKDLPDFWRGEGKTWSKERDKFMNAGGTVKELVATLVQPQDTQQQKAEKLYAAVMKIENTDFSRERTTREERAAGFKEVKDVGDVVKRNRGTGDQLAQVFVSMARAAGLKAYLMGVADRSERFFISGYLSLNQIDDYIAILNIDGKETYWDPGSRFCEPGHLAWKHGFAGGLRQTEGGTELATTPHESFKFSTIKRIADLTLDDHGEASGNVSLTFTGDPALHWREEALRGDDTSLNTDLRTHMERMLPGGMEVRVTQVDNLAAYDKPLKVTYTVSGAVGSSTGKRLLVPADIFESNAKPKFPEAKRELAVDMHYSEQTQDAVRYKLPAGLVLESAPEASNLIDKSVGGFETFTRKASNSVSSFRNVTMTQPLYSAADYSGLRKFYGDLETKDQETLILTRAAAGAAVPATAVPATAAPATAAPASTAAATPAKPAGL